MMKTFLLASLLLSTVANVSCQLSNNCLMCICQVEGCESQVGKCRFDVTGDACGPFQIHEGYWTDCGSPGGDWRTCTKEMACSVTCVNKYLARYAARCSSPRAPTCEDYARVHNGGPQGCKRQSTVGYWNLVNACCRTKGSCVSENTLHYYIKNHLSYM